MSAPLLRRSVPVVAVLLVAVAVAAWFGGRGGPGKDAPNVLVISIDTLRADRLGCYGYERDTTPAIDRFAEGAVRFSHAVAESSWTIPSHVTMLSGLHPTRHGVGTPEDLPGDDVTMLAERLSEAGYYTFGITDGGWVSEEQGFARGFLSFHARDQGLARNLEDAADYIRHREKLDDGPWFGFVHTYDVHCPYDPAQPFRSMYTSDGRDEFDADGKCGNPHFNDSGVTNAQALYLSDRYDGGVRQMDAELEGFLTFLEDSGRMKDTIVILTSDHGEELNEHGQIGHERTLFREALEIPLIIAAPGAEPRTVAAITGLVDLVPTIADWIDLDLDDDETDGRSLAPWLRGLTVPDWPTHHLSVLDWDVELTSWLGPNTHMIVDREQDQRVMFDLGADPLEQSNVADMDPERAGKLKTELDNAFDQLHRKQLEPSPRGSLSEERLQDLQRIGYGG